MKQFLDDAATRICSTIYKTLPQVRYPVVAASHLGHVYSHRKLVSKMTAERDMVNRDLVIRDLDSIADLRSAIGLEKEVWGSEDADVTPLAIAIATRATGGLWIGTFDGSELIGFAFAFFSLNTSLDPGWIPGRQIECSSIQTSSP